MTIAGICTSKPEIFGRLHKCTGALALDGIDLAERMTCARRSVTVTPQTKGICKASSCAVGSPMSAGRRIQVQSFVVATVSVSLGAKPAQDEGECLIVHRLDTVALLHSCLLCLQTCQTHLVILPTHSRWLKVCQKTELHLTLSLFVSSAS